MSEIKVRFAIAVERASSGEGAAEMAPAVRELLRGVEQAGLWATLSTCGPQGSPGRRRLLGSVEELLARDTWDESTTWELRASEERPGDDALFVRADVGTAHIIHVVAGQSLAGRARALLDAWVKAVQMMVPALTPRFVVGPQMSVTIGGLPYRRLRPPPWHPVFGRAGVLDILSERYHTRPESTTRAAFLAAALGTVPAKVVRERHGDLLVLRWIDSLARDVKQIATRMAQREEWIASLPGATLAAGWNALGDLKMRVVGEKKGPLTAYDRASRTGFLAVAVDDSGEGADAELTKAAQWIANGRLPNGSPLASLILVTKRRSGALALAGRAQRLRAGGVAYVDDAGSYWNPFPSLEV
jgi:hypothetical protein